MSTRLLFLVMSAVHKAAAVDQLAAALAPHLVLVHHDFSQTRDFKLNSANVVFVPAPIRTGWSDWGFTEGIFHSLRYARDNIEFDYLKLLSPSCLPIKPLGEFVNYVESSGLDANYDYVDIFEDRDALMTAGYRVTAVDTIRYRALYKLSRLYFGPTPTTRDLAGIQLYVKDSRETSLVRSLQTRLAYAAVAQSLNRIRAKPPFSSGFPLCFGAPWFGARRSVIERMLEAFALRGVDEYFRHIFAADEFLFPSVLRHVSSNGGPLRHLVTTFNGARPNWFCDNDFETIESSDAFFARKFPDDETSPLRLKVLQELVNQPDLQATT